MPDRLLDTNAVSAVMRQDARATAWLNSIDEDDHLFASVVTNAEVRYGIRRTPAGRRKEALEQAYDFFLDQMEDLLPVTREVSERCAEIKASLESRGITLPENDLWIAATALVHQLILVTNDRHFATVPALSTEDWALAAP